jgi:hypothetical protein
MPVAPTVAPPTEAPTVAPPTEEPTDEAVADTTGDGNPAEADLPAASPADRDPAAATTQEASTVSEAPVEDPATREGELTTDTAEAASREKPKQEDPPEVPRTLGGLIATVGQGLNSAQEGIRDWTEQQQREALGRILSPEDVERVVNILNVDRRIGATIRERLGVKPETVWSAVAAFADSAIPTPLSAGYKALRATIFDQAAQLRQLREGKQLETEDTQN